jgi:plasmid stabilization system protein ParE
VKYRLSGPAKEDVWEIWSYLAEHATLDTADRVVTELHEAMERLAERPDVGHLRTDLAGESLRFWRVHSYLVVYLPESTPLAVVRVLHGSRDVKTLIDEDLEE